LIEDDPENFKDAVGDCVVVLTILSAQCNMTLEACIESAYEQIKDRKGKMINGKFVKEA
jgi:NTP pyrophosphatase (non-canonical NTP hydrolase)